MEIGKTSLKILKYLNNNDEKPITEIEALFGKDINKNIEFLMNNKYIKVHHLGTSSDYNHLGWFDSYYAIDGAGEAYLSDRRSANIKFLIPTTISIIALIGAYREELLSAIQAIMKLLKSTVGG